MDAHPFHTHRRSDRSPNPSSFQPRRNPEYQNPASTKALQVPVTFPQTFSDLWPPPRRDQLGCPGRPPHTISPSVHNHKTTSSSDFCRLTLHIFDRLSSHKPLEHIPSPPRGHTCYHNGCRRRWHVQTAGTRCGRDKTDTLATPLKNTESPRRPNKGQRGQVVSPRSPASRSSRTCWPLRLRPQHRRRAFLLPEHVRSWCRQ